MKPNLLITFASKYGSTREIAERIQDKLTEKGINSDLLPVEDVTDLKPYDALILGSAVYIGKWRRSAVNFLHHNLETLKDMRLWIFSSGPTGEGDPKELLQDWNMPKALKEVVDQLNPEDIAIFHGSLDPSVLNFLEKLAIRQVKAPVGDFRNWNAIDEWAEKIGDSMPAEVI